MKRSPYKNFVGRVVGDFTVIEDNGSKWKLSCNSCSDEKYLGRYIKKSVCLKCKQKNDNNVVVPLDISLLDSDNFLGWDILRESGTEYMPESYKKIDIKCKCCGEEKTITYISYKLKRTVLYCDLVQTKRTKLMKVRKGMIKRCHSSNLKKYKRYAGRGIIVCDEWRDSTEKFIEWALNNNYETHLDIDRIDNDGNYEPSNCRFVTPLVNSRNTSRCTLTEELVIQLKTTDWKDKNYREITEAIGLDGVKNVAGVWAVLNEKTWVDI